MIVCNFGNLIPITAWPAHRDHCVVKGATAYCRRSWIENAVSVSIQLGVRLLRVAVMFNEELPTEIRMLAGVRMERRNLRNLRRIPPACLEDKHAKTILCQICSKRTAARAGADDDEIVLCGLLFGVKSGVSQ